MVIIGDSSLGCIQIHGVVGVLMPRKQLVVSVSNEFGRQSFSANYTCYGAIPSFGKGSCLKSDMRLSFAKFAYDFPAVTRGLIPDSEIGGLKSFLKWSSLQPQRQDRAYCTWFEPLGSHFAGRQYHVHYGIHTFTQ